MEDQNPGVHKAETTGPVIPHPVVIPTLVNPNPAVTAPISKPPATPISPTRVGPTPTKPPTPPPAKPVVKPVEKPDVQLLHKVFPSGNHELTLSIPNRAIHSGQVGPNELARCIDPRTKKIYCAAASAANGLPEVFTVENVPFQHIKAN